MQGPELQMIPGAASNAPGSNQVVVSSGDGSLVAVSNPTVVEMSAAGATVPSQQQQQLPSQVHAQPTVVAAVSQQQQQQPPVPQEMQAVGKFPFRRKNTLITNRFYFDKKSCIFRCWSHVIEELQERG